MIVRLPLPIDAEENFRAKIAVSGDDDCWPWTGATPKHAQELRYGSFNLPARIRLRAAEAPAIRERYARGGISLAKLAAEHEVSVIVIHNIVRFVTHPDAGGPRAPAKRAPNAKLSLDDYATIVARHDAGETYPTLAREFNVHPATIKRIWRDHVISRQGRA